MDFNGRWLISATLMTSQVAWTAVESEDDLERQGAQRERERVDERESEGVTDWLIDRLWQLSFFLS